MRYARAASVSVLDPRGLSAEQPSGPHDACSSAHQGDPEAPSGRGRQSVRPFNADQFRTRLQRGIAEQHVEQSRRVVADRFERQRDAHIEKIIARYFASQHPPCDLGAYVRITHRVLRTLDALLDRQRLSARRNSRLGRLDSLDRVHSTHSFC